MTDRTTIVKSMLTELAQLCRQHQICTPATVTEERLLELLGQHFELLLKWNEKISLTRLIEPAAAARQLYFEPLYAARFINPPIGSLADLGAGAGFPGLPLAVLLPQLPVALIEADRRKAAFLSEARRQLQLTNLTVINERFENVMETFAALTARALERFSEQLSNIFKVGQSSQQLLLFISQADAQQLITNPPIKLAAQLATFSTTIELLPESQERAILVLQR